MSNFVIQCKFFMFWLRNLCLLLIAVWVFFFANSASALTISPALFDLEMSPGEKSVKEIVLFNETNQSLNLAAITENFESGRNNVPKFLGKTDKTGAAYWITPREPQITIASGERKKIILDIAAPLDAEPGGHYAALFWTEATSDSNGIKTFNRLGSLFLFKVKGNIKEELKIIDFTAKKDNGQVKIFLNLENSGTVHSQPVGQVKIFNLRRQQIAVLPINPLKQKILPQSRRNFEFNWQLENGSWGNLFIEAKFFYGDNKIIDSERLKIWLWPAKLGQYAAGGAAILLLLFVIGKLTKKRKK